jgi:hypothetical protein
VLCSEDRIAIGRIEDTFGPVMCPLYTLRWAGQGDMPSSLTVDAPVFTTHKLAEYLLAEQLYTNVSHLPKIDAVYVSSINRHRFVLVDIVLYVSAVL